MNHALRMKQETGKHEADAIYWSTDAKTIMKNPLLFYARKKSRFVQSA
jgi:hypothetical protein